MEHLRVQLGEFGGESAKGRGNGVELYLPEYWPCGGVVGICVDHVVRTE